MSVNGNDPPRRRGQLASERARYELGSENEGEAAALGAPGEGIGLTFVRGWIRDPHHVVAAWDVHDPEMLRRAEAIGWDRLCVRAIDARNRVLVQVLVGRASGTHHLAVPSGRTVRLAIGLERSDGRFLTLARSAAIRMPPERPVTRDGAEVLRVPAALDRRALLRGEDPARPGHRTPGRVSPAWRLYARLALAARVLPPDRVPADLTELVQPGVPHGLAPVPPTTAGPAPFDDDRNPGELDTFGRPPAAGTPDGGGAPRHWLDRWASGQIPTSSGNWMSGRDFGHGSGRGTDER